MSTSRKKLDTFFKNINLVTLTGKVVGHDESTIEILGDDGTVNEIKVSLGPCNDIEGRTAYVEGHLSSSEVVADKLRLFSGEGAKNGKCGA